MGTVVLSALGTDGSAGGERAAGIQDALLRVLQSRGEDVHLLDLTQAKVQPCLACGGCSTTGACVLKDDMTRIPAEIASCERLILATPILFGIHHPLLKKAVDRLLPLAGERFAVRGGEMHHQPRHSGSVALLGVGWLREGARPAEAETFQRLIARHAVNLACTRHSAAILREGEPVERAIHIGIEQSEARR